MPGEYLPNKGEYLNLLEAKRSGSDFPDSQQLAIKLPHLRSNKFGVQARNDNIKGILLF